MISQKCTNIHQKVCLYISFFKVRYSLFLAPTRSCLLCVCLSAAFNQYLSSLSAVSQQSLSSLPAVSQQSFSSPSAVPQQSLSSLLLRSLSEVSQQSLSSVLAVSQQSLSSLSHQSLSTVFTLSQHSSQHLSNCWQLEPKILRLVKHQFVKVKRIHFFKDHQATPEIETFTNWRGRCNMYKIFEHIFYISFSKFRFRKLWDFKKTRSSNSRYVCTLVLTPLLNGPFKKNC